MRKRIILIVVLLFVVAAGVGFVVLNQEIFDRITVVDAKCLRRGDEGTYTPDNFERQGFDTSAYLMNNYETVTFPARDGVEISGFFIPALVPDISQASTVIIVHGFNDCKHRPHSLLPASMLQRNGFNSLVIDLRNHGDSQVTTARMTGGVDEAQDVLGAWDWLIAQQGISPENIGIFGYSLGGSTIIHAMSDEPRIVAGWSDSTFDAMDSVLRLQLSLNEPSFPEFLSQSVLSMGRLFHNVDLRNNTTADAIQELGDRPLFVLHSTEDETVPFAAFTTLVATASETNEQVVAWAVGDSLHIEHMFNDPVNYEERLVAFFDEHLN